VTAEIQPGPPELPMVRIADCRCILSVDIPPIGFKFVSTPTGDRRQLVYGCPAHTHLSVVVETDLPLKKPKPRRAAKSSPSKGTKPRPKSSDDQPKPEPT
jgi:hypothetical protein